MPINHDMMHAQSPDDVSALKARIAELESMPHTDNSAVIDALETENFVRNCANSMPRSAN